MNKQSQKSGDNSTNYQAQNITVVSGIDEKRAREVYQEISLKLKEEFAQEALKVANSRVSEFESILLPKMQKIDGAFEAFADPSFQILLSEAQKTAASTERLADYDLLSELLVHRFAKGEDRIVRAGVNRAVEIIDEISDGALLGLTIFYSVTNFFIKTGNIEEGLDKLNELYGKLLYSDLPTGTDWLDHLDILDTVRLSPFSSVINLEQYFTEIFYGYIDVGIKKGSESFTKAVNILKENNLPTDFLVEHALNSKFLRIPIANRSSIDSLFLISNFPYEGGYIKKRIPLSEKQKEVVNSIYDLYSNDSSARSENTRILMKKLYERPNIDTIFKWWGSLNLGIQVTSVGKVLAHSNAQRCDNNLPAFN